MKAVVIKENFQFQLGTPDREKMVPGQGNFKRCQIEGALPLPQLKRFTRAPIVPLFSLGIRRSWLNV